MMLENGSPLLWLLSIGGGYLLGAVPFGLVLTRLAGYGDIRKIGSGNIGATNVLRTGNRPLALTVLVLDAGKGGFAAALAWWLVGWEAGVFAGTAAFVGHLYPVWLGFRGGKGVATGLGTFAAVSWPIFVGMALAWLATAAVTRRSSAGALGAFTALPLLTAVFGERAAASAIALPYWFVILGFLLAAVVWYKHRANVSRLIQGTEPAISFGGGKAQAEPGIDGDGTTDRGEE